MSESPSAPATAPSHGRFAPSPTGPLHFGSLVAAVGSYLQARRRGGLWSLRIEDLDRPRCRDEIATDMLRTLEAFGFAWDGEIMWQSRRSVAYDAALDRLRSLGQVYPCACTRRELSDSMLAPDGAAIYPGTCRGGLPEGKDARAWRLRVPALRLSFDDAVQGVVTQHLADEVGDFVLRRADGIAAYQLAVVVDDAEQGITEIVRGADLLASTGRQILLQQMLAYPTPTYAHLPVAVDASGQKLSKQTLAQPIDAARPTAALLAALRFLGQQPPPQLAAASIADIWRWAGDNWAMAKVTSRRALPLEA